MVKKTYFKIKKMRKKIVAANWKMNLLKSEAIDLFKEMNDIEIPSNTEVLVFAPFLFLDALSQFQDKIQLGSQNFYPLDKGAFTGEISYSQLKDLGIKNVLIGHSERRIIFKEDNTLIRQKIDVAIENNLNPIYCCGEQLEIRESNQHIEFVIKQLQDNLFHLSNEQIQKVVIAYEPVWAIGTGKTASTAQAEEMHLAIRAAIASTYSSEIANNISILYGGSCNAQNANELFSCENIDGGLIGGASLNAIDFKAIILS
jgi:triosephosphate isomerase